MKLILCIVVIVILYKKFVLYPVKIGHNHLSVFFGIPGSGKTTIAACMARRYQRKHIPVYSNVAIKGCYKFDCMEELGKYEIKSACVIIDEASIEFNSRSYKTFPKHLIAWFKKHRHEKCEVLIFSQDYQDFDATIKRLAYKYYLCRPGLLPFTVQAVPIVRKFGINDQTKKPDDIYKLHHPLVAWIYNQTFFAPLVWNNFNSWESLNLPKKQFFKYEDADFEKPKKPKKNYIRAFQQKLLALKYYRVLRRNLKKIGYSRSRE